MSNREAKYTALMEELKWWGFDDASIEKKTAQALKTISHQLSWRTTMRIINALRRKRNVESESDCEKNKEQYHFLEEVFYDFYYGQGIVHGDKPDTVFAYGDVVTTGCGWDLGFHSGVENRVYSRVSPYRNDRAMYGGVVDWYKTGVNVTWKEWEDMCRQFQVT